MHSRLRQRPGMASDWVNQGAGVTGTPTESMLVMALLPFLTDTVFTRGLAVAVEPPS